MLLMQQQRYCHAHSILMVATADAYLEEVQPYS